jgi:hypothetical protein
MQEPLLPLSYPSSQYTGDYTGKYAGQTASGATSSSFDHSNGNECDAAEDLSVIFNTAFVRSRAPASERDLAAELAELAKSPAYHAIMNAAQQLARTQNISELEAAEQIVATFRKMDDVWGAYLTQEGLARITS